MDRHFQKEFKAEAIEKKTFGKHGHDYLIPADSIISVSSCFLKADHAAFSRRMISFLHRNAGFFLAFLLPVVVLGAAFLVRGITPFGDCTLTAIDGWGQYFPMLREAERWFFRDPLGQLLPFASSGSWSFSGMLGYDMRAQSAYYTNSPLWILIYLIPGPITALQVNMMVIFRYALAGLTFYTFIRKMSGERWGRLKELKQGEAGDHSKERNFLPVPALIFSLAYALSGWSMAFINQFMWADALWLAPLVLLGLENIFRKQRPLMYFLSLSVLIRSCFYTAWMVCLFCCIWCLKCLVVYRISRKEKLKGFLIFASASLAAGIVCLPVLIPLVRALSQTNAAGLKFDGKLSFNQFVLAPFARLLPFIPVCKDYVKVNIYCGLLSCIPAGWFLFSGKVRKSARIFFGVLIAFFFLSFSLNILDYLWHGFHFPNQLPGRYTFLFVFTLLYMTWYGSIILDEKIGESRKTGLWLKLLFCLLLFAEIIGNTLVSVGKASCVYVSGFTPYERVFDTHLALLTPDTSKGEFFRTELANFRDNGGLMYGYNGISYYSSTMSKEAYTFFQRMGLPIYAKNVSTRYASTPELNALFSVRYLVGKAQDLEGKGIKWGEITRDPEVKGIEWGETTPDPEVKEVKCGKPAVNSKKWFSMGENGRDWQKIAEKVEYAGGKDRSLFSCVEEEGDYVILENHACFPLGFVTDPALLEINKDLKGERLQKEIIRIIAEREERGERKAGVSIPMDNGKDKEIESSRLTDTAESLKTHAVIISEITAKSLKGKLNVTEPGLLLFSLPESDCGLYLNGEKAEQVKVLDYLLGCSVEEGEYEVEVRFE